MSAYNRSELSPEAYLVRLLAAIVRQNGGELRVKGELVDQIGEPTALIKEWDQKTQEVVLRAGMGSFTEVFKVIPERQTQREVIAARPPQLTDPLSPLFDRRPPERANGEASEFLPKASTVEDTERLSELERKTRLRRAAATIRAELELRKRERAQTE